jgi:DNA-binding ferritin-like protein
MFEKLISTLLASRDQAHIFHWQTKGPGSYAAHMALNTFYDEIIILVDGLVESYQGKNGIITGYTTPASFDDYDRSTTVKYFKALAMFIEKASDKLKSDSYIQNQIDTIIELVYSTVYKLENLQ